MRRAAVVLLVAVLASVHVGTASAAGAIGEVYVTKKADVPSGSRRSLTVMCPNGRPVLSGHTYVGGTDLTLEVASSGPVDGGDRDHTPDDGWKGSISNDGPSKEKMNVRVQCGRRKDRSNLRYVSLPGIFQDGVIGGPVLSCDPGEIAISGGAVGGGKTRAAPLSATMADDGTDGDALPQDGWRIQVWNSSGKDVNMTSTVICAQIGGAFQVVDSPPTNIPANFQTYATATCPANYYALGGGASVTNASAVPLTIASTLMLHPNGSSSTGWRAWMNNITNVTGQFIVRAVCYTAP